MNIFFRGGRLTPNKKGILLFIKFFLKTFKKTHKIEEGLWFTKKTTQ